MPGMSSPNLEGEEASALTPGQPPQTGYGHVPPLTGPLPHSPLHPLFGGLAFELPRLPLFEFGWALPGGGGSPRYPRG